jgi:hypothetical protein
MGSLSRVDQLIAELAGESSTATARGSAIFAVDATASRQPTWDAACQLQAAMFHEAGKIGGLDLQLVYFRGPRDFGGECKASRWLSNAADLTPIMAGLKCMGGLTQIERVLTHAANETLKRRVNAVVFIGDAFEESWDQLATPAAKLGRLGVPVFMFQEGNSAKAEPPFRQIAEATHGAYQRFDQSSAKLLGELLRAVAAFAVGGIRALESQNSSASRLLLQQLR